MVGAWKTEGLFISCDKTKFQGILTYSYNWSLSMQPSKYSGTHIDFGGEKYVLVNCVKAKETRLSLIKGICELNSHFDENIKV